LLNLWSGSLNTLLLIIEVALWTLFVKTLKRFYEHCFVKNLIRLCTLFFWNRELILNTNLFKTWNVSLNTVLFRIMKWLNTFFSKTSQDFQPLFGIWISFLLQILKLVIIIFVLLVIY
jgi:hypothetical protein